MRKSAGLVLFLAVLWACGGNSGTPTSPSNGDPPSSSSSPTASPTSQGTANAEVSGPIDSLAGSASSFQFKIGSRVIHGASSTTFDSGGNRPASFADLKNGSRVEVKGQQADGFVQAMRIHIEDDEAEPEDNDNDDDKNKPEVENEDEVKGTLTALAGSCPALTFTVASTKVMTSSATRFDDVACSGLKNNDQVEAKGTKRTDGVLQATRVERK